MKYVEQSEFKLEKIIGISEHAGKVRKGTFFFLTGLINKFSVFKLFMILKKIINFSFKIGFTYGARFS